MSQRCDYTGGEPLRTIYVGGGTPSLLEVDDLARLFDAADRLFGLQVCEEITLEANPDDLTTEYLSALVERTPVNRLSIGVQTFHDDLLHMLGRRHTAGQAIDAIGRCRRLGIKNLSIDLMYGLPGQTMDMWLHDLETAIDLAPDHISAYHLTYEEGTPLGRMLRRGKVHEVDEELSVAMLRALVDHLSEAGYLHYEISNFCRPGRHSRHNSSYWDGSIYIGCGLGAHSYDGHSRQWTTGLTLLEYIEAYEQGLTPHFQREELSPTDLYNEIVMTRLRTSRGLDLAEVGQNFGNRQVDYCLRMAQPYLQAGRLRLVDNHLQLTPDGLFVSDGIIADLFM